MFFLTEHTESWTAEEMQILEKFFDMKVACPPYKINPLIAFAKLMVAPVRALKDCVQIMRLELVTIARSFCLVILSLSLSLCLSQCSPVL